MLKYATWHGGSNQKLDLTLFFLHSLFKVFEKEPLHISHNLPEKGQSGWYGIHAPLTGSPYKVHDQAHLAKNEKIKRLHTSSLKCISTVWHLCIYLHLKGLEWHESK